MGKRRATVGYEFLYREFEMGFTRGVQKSWKYITFRYPSDSERFRVGSFGVATNAAGSKPPLRHIGGNDNEQKAMRQYPAYFDADQLYDLDSDPKYVAEPARMRQELKTYLERLPGGFAELKPVERTAESRANTR